MSAATIHKGKAFEDTEATIIGRICAVQGTGATSPVPREGKLLLQADISTLIAKAYTAAGALINSYTLTIASCIFDTLGTTITWANLQGGGNLRAEIPATAFPAGSETVTIEVTATLTDGKLARGVWEITVLPLNQS